VKSLVAFAATLAVSALAAPAFAQTLPVVGPVSYQASLGYTDANIGSLNFGMATLRARADFAKYFGLEGEAGVGIVDQNPMVGSVTLQTHINDEYAAYGVVRYPVLANLDVFARGGYGHTDVKASAIAAGSVTAGFDSWNYGAGAEYFVDNNGVRIDYTRMSFQDRGLGDADTVTVSYVRKF
jgi:hypothetical protein